VRIHLVPLKNTRGAPNVTTPDPYGTE